jgi:tRNA pseudouridine65 synthase
LNANIARKITQQFTQRDVTKHYLAVVRGYTLVEGIIDYALKEQFDKMTDKKVKQDKEAQDAVSHYSRQARVELPFAVGRYATARYSLLSLTPKTGRKHQLRRHMKHIFHPIIGDTSHGDGKQNAFFREYFDCHRLLLHADCLCLKHPVFGDDLLIKASLDHTFQHITDSLFTTR